MTEKKPPFEGKLVYVGKGGRWVAGVPRRDITAEEWVQRGYSDRANFTPEELVATGLYELKPPRAKPGTASAVAKEKPKADVPSQAKDESEAETEPTKSNSNSNSDKDTDTNKGGD